MTTAAVFMLGLWVGGALGFLFGAIIRLAKTGDDEEPRVPPEIVYLDDIKDAMHRSASPVP